MRIYISCFVLLFLFSCKSSPLKGYEKVDLLSQGIPVEVMAPPGAEVGKDDLGIMEGAWVKADNYYIQIYSANTSTLDLTKLMAAKLAEVKNERYFSKIVEEEENGFIFEKDIDGNIRYDFRLIKVIGDKEIVFQRGLVGTYSEESVRLMYESVK